MNAESGPQTIPTWDSAGHRRVIVELQTELDLEIPDEKISEFVTVGAIAEFGQSEKAL